MSAAAGQGPGLEPVSFRRGRAHQPRLSKPYDPGKRHPRYWTEAEHDVLRKYFPTGGAVACEVHLPNRPRSSIYQTAKKLGLKSPRRPGPYKRIEVDDGFDERLRDRWAELKGRGAVGALADELGVPRCWLTKRATRLGLTMPHRKEPPWTEAEIALMSRAPLHDPEQATRLFRQHGFSRTPTSIMVKAKRLGLSRRASRPTLSATQVARILGMDNKTVCTWCIAGEIRANRRGTKRLPQQGGDVWDITRAELRRFVIDNLERIDFRKVDKFELVEILIGQEALKP